MSLVYGFEKEEQEIEKTDIVTITISNNNCRIFGLGRNNHIYYWDEIKGNWKLYKTS
jgi:hypothetical protein